MILNRINELIGRFQREAVVLYYAYQDPRTPWYARVFSAFIVVHTLSPIDLIPDFIPILGYLDDLLIIPIGIYLSVKMIPAEVLRDAREKAAQGVNLPKSLKTGYIILVVGIWVLVTVILFRVIIYYWSRSK